MVATSAAMLVTTYTPASTMARNWIVGMSRAFTAVLHRAADARVVEDGLDDDDAGGEVGDVEGDHLEDRPERIGEGVAAHHLTLSASP